MRGAGGKSLGASTYQPAKYPTTLPCLPAVMDAQWYTPALDGIADAISAMHAAIIQ